MPFSHDADFPKPTVPTISVSDLRPGDVLLSRGDALLSDVIVSADGGSYSHAALWTGADVIEAVSPRIMRSERVQGRDAYRWNQPEGLPEAAATQIVRNAERYLGQSYDYSELVLLGGLYALGFAPRRTLFQRAMDAFGEDLEQAIRALRPSVTPMFCSALVAAAYYRLEGISYDIEVSVARAQRRHRQEAARELTRGAAVRGSPHVETPPEEDDALADEQLAHLQLTCRRALALPAPEQPEEVRLRGVVEPIARDAETGARLGFVTPADLQFSPSLRFVGCIP